MTDNGQKIAGWLLVNKNGDWVEAWSAIEGHDQYSGDQKMMQGTADAYDGVYPEYAPHRVVQLAEDPFTKRGPQAEAGAGAEAVETDEAYSIRLKKKRDSDRAIRREAREAARGRYGIRSSVIITLVVLFGIVLLCEWGFSTLVSFSFALIIGYHFRKFTDTESLGLQGDIDELEEEIDGLYITVIRQGDKLRRIVNAIKGAPEPGSSHSTHNAPELVEELLKEVTDLRALRKEPTVKDWPDISSTSDS